MNYVFIAEDKNGKDTAFIKRIGVDCYMKILKIERNNSNTPFFQFFIIQYEDINRESIWADIFIDNQDKIDKIEQEMISEFKSLFGVLLI